MVRGRKRKLPNTTVCVLETSSSSCNISYDSSDNAENTISTQKEPEYSVESIKNFLPQYPDRLFAKISKSKDIQKIVSSMFFDMESHKEAIFKSIVQLFIDISSYQFINIDTYLINYQIQDIVSYLENKNNSLLTSTGKYFLKIQTSPFRTRRRKIEEFLETFVVFSAKSKLLYDSITYRHLIKIIRNMSNSNIRPIKHTGVFLATKLLTGFLRVTVLIIEKLEKYQKELEKSNDEDIKQFTQNKLNKYLLHADTLKQLQEFVYLNIFMPHWKNGDSQLHFMRRDCVEEICTWITTFPERFLRNNSLHLVHEALTDGHYIVRSAAIHVFSKILSEYYNEIPEKIRMQYLISVSKRIKDKNFTLAIDAVNTITLLLPYFKKVPYNIREEICKHIYYPYYPLAAACGRYLVVKMRLSLGEEDPNPVEFLKMVLYFENKAVQKGLVNYHPNLIESIIDHFPYLYDIPAYMTVLQEFPADSNNEILLILIKILTESVKQIFTGKSSLPREKSRKGKIDHELIKKISADLIGSLNKLAAICPLEKLTPLLVLLRDHAIR